MGSEKQSTLKTDASQRRAVIDIGSNSVRLVIYGGPHRAPIPTFNEKALCGLGRDITDEGRLNPDAVAEALDVLKRFSRLFNELGNPPAHVFATAAVREAKDGKKFVSKVKDLGFDVSIISGAEEAKLAALGVVSFEPGATGIAGDMGGGSLELVALNNNELTDSVSLPIGPFSIMRSVGDDMRAAKKLVEQELDAVSFLKTADHKTLYSVGGAWRAIARIHMRLRSYPLSILHHYEMTNLEVIEICELVANQTRRSLEGMPGLPRRRIDTLPYAALVLKSVLKRTGAERVIVSAGGVREGLLYDELSKSERKEDPLIAACRFYADRLSPNALFGEVASQVIAPLFAKDNVAQKRLRLATCILCDTGAYFHTDMRALHVFDTALRAPFVGYSHKERVWVALALYRRHEGLTDTLPHEQAIGLLSWEDQQSAARLGLALRFVSAFAPKVNAPLAGCRLELDEGRLIFRAPKDCQELMGETPRKRLAALATAFDAKPAEVFDD